MMQDGTHLLLDHTIGPPTRDQAVRVWKEIGGLPLLIVSVAWQITESHIDLSIALKAIQSSSKGLQHIL